MSSVVDALGRSVVCATPPRRVVSLVPSETESVAALAGIARLAGRTSFCIEPAGEIESIPIVGGTKKVDVPAVIALEPDLVLANKEENGRADVEALLRAGLNVHVSFPCTVTAGLAYLRSLARLLHVREDAEPIAAATRAFESAHAALGATTERVPVFVPIWKGPWMTFDGRTFASDLLELCGAENVFSDRPRRYPLAADLGLAPALPDARVAGRDTRYPRVTLEEVRSRGPAAVLLPDEPYAFVGADAADFVHFGTPAVLTCGKDLFWYGTRIGVAIPRIRGLLGTFRHAEPEDAGI